MNIAINMLSHKLINYKVCKKTSSNHVICILQDYSIYACDVKEAIWKKKARHFCVEVTC